MAEIAKFVNHNASLITPTMVDKLMRNLPLWKAEFAQINAPKYPHLVNQLEFLADAVEDAWEKVYNDLPYFAFAEAVFALMYVHKQVGIIPDFIPQMGHADDSSVVRAVLIQNSRYFRLYAAAQGVEWESITSQP